MTDVVATLLARGQAAVEAIQRGSNSAGTAAAEAFTQLQVIREMLELAGSRQYDRALQVCGSVVQNDCKWGGVLLSSEATVGLVGKSAVVVAFLQVLALAGCAAASCTCCTRCE